MMSKETYIDLNHEWITVFQRQMSIILVTFLRRGYKPAILALDWVCERRHSRYERRHGQNKRLSEMHVTKLDPERKLTQARAEVVALYVCQAHADEDLHHRAEWHEKKCCTGTCDHGSVHEKE